MTDVILFVFLFVLGAIVGSFLNVVGLRYRSGLTLGGRSACAHCAKRLRWWELVPVLSFVGLRGRCASCKGRISYQYPAVEIFSGIVFATLPPEYWAIFCIYIVILVYDMRHKIIPDGLVYFSSILAVVLRFLFLASTTVDWLIGPILLGVFALGWFLSKGRALGLGDGKLALSIGLLLGLAQGLSAMAMAFWIGTAVTLPFILFAMKFKQKRITIKTEVPFGPFMILGAWAALAFNLDIFHVLSLHY